MTALSRLEKLEEKLIPKVKKTYFIGWGNCEWKKCEDLIRGEDESKEQFFNRVKRRYPKKIVHCCY